MDLNFGRLFASFAYGVFGFFLLKQGKQRGNFVWVGIGLVLMIYPYFVDSTLWTWLIGALLLGLAYPTRFY